MLNEAKMPHALQVVKVGAFLVKCTSLPVAQYFYHSKSCALHSECIECIACNGEEEEEEEEFYMLLSYDENKQMVPREAPACPATKSQLTSGPLA